MIRPIRLSIVLALFAIPVLTVFADGPQNQNFEKDDNGAAPSGWVVPTKGYTAEVRKAGAKQGEQYMRLAGSGGGTGFGNVMQSFDATPYRGKSICLRAAIRTRVSNGNKAQMWLRADRGAGKMGFFDNMGDRPITSGKWKYYEIVGDIPWDAKSINIGVMLMRQGSVDVDDMSFTVLKDQTPAQLESPRPLAGHGRENLVAFTRLFGYVRYFHPSKEAAKADWNSLAAQGAKAVESASTPKDLAKKLQAFFRPVAPTIRVFITGSHPDVPTELKKPQDVEQMHIVRWMHRGVGVSSAMPGLYFSKRESIALEDGDLPDGARDPADPFIAELGGGVSCMVPLSLYEQKINDPAGSEGDDEQADSQVNRARPSGGDRATRLGDVVITWNVFQHFYPYFDVVKTDWPAALNSALDKAATDTDECAFYDTLRALVAQLHDGHGAVMHSCQAGRATLPLVWTWVRDELVVVRVDDELRNGPHRGDVVEKIDGRTVLDMYADAEKMISASTPQWRRYRALSALSTGDANKKVTLALRKPSGERFVVELNRTADKEPLAEARPDKIAELKPGIFYIDVQRADDDDFKKILPRLQKAKGIIYDYRGYPKMMPESLFSNISRETCESPQWHVPITRTPDRRDVTLERDGQWHLPPAEPYLSAKKAFLIDGRAISYCESCLGIVEHYKLGALIGQPTAGTNGNVNPMSLPGGYTIYWTGMKVLKQDGSRHHGVGIQPTIPLSPTIKGIAAGRDEILEKAIEVVSKGDGAKIDTRASK